MTRRTTHTVQPILAILAFCMILSCAIPAAADPYLGGIPLETVREGQVSGGLFVEGSYPMTNDATASFSIPEYTAIQWARLYVVVYCGHMQNNYQVQADIEFNGGQGSSALATEILNVPYTFPGEGGTGPVRVNDHTTRVTSDYLMWYNVKDRIQNKNLQARVKTSRPAGYTGTFDGRIKAIVLVVAYDDGDRDQVVYWVNQGHDEDSDRTEEMLGETYVGETSFATSTLDDDWDRADLVVVYLASENAEYEFNRDSLAPGSPVGGYAGLDRHDVTDSIWRGKDSDLFYDNTGRYYKIMLATLAVRYPGSDAGSLKVTSVPGGATIYLDEEEQEELTNTTLPEISLGYHTVRVEKEGYRAPSPQQVSIQTGEESTVNFVLQQARGTISVESIPEGAEVLIDGTLHSALTPCVITDVPAGERDITVRYAGYQEWEEAAYLEDGETLSIEAELVPAAQGVSSSGGSSGSGSTQGSAGMSGYRGEALALYRQGRLNGTLFYIVASDYTGMIPSGQKKVYTLPEPIPRDGEVALSRLYLYTTWSHDITKREGVSALPTVSWNGKQLKAAAMYTDRKGEGVYDYPVQTFAYDLKGIVKPGDLGEVQVVNSGSSGREFAAYGVMLLAILENATAPEITYWICEGSDIILADPRFGTSSDDSRTKAEFSGEVEKAGITGSRVLIVSTAASGEGGDQHQVVFNDGEWYNPLVGGSSGVSTAELDTLSLLARTGNLLEVVSLPVSGAGDYMENRNAVLVLTRGGPGKVPAGENAVPAGTPLPAATRSPGEGQETHMREDETGTTTTEPHESGPTIPPPQEGGFAGNFIEWLFDRIFALFGISRSTPEGPAAGRVPEGTTAIPDRNSGGDMHAIEGGGYPAGDTGQDPQPGYATETSLTTGDGAGQEQSSSPVDERAAKTTGSSMEKVVTGGVFIDSYPGGADIFIDGRQVPAKTPFVANWLKGGMHSIRVEMEAITFSPDSRQVWVTPGEITTAHFSVGATTVRRLTINSTEWKGAQFTVNGRGPLLRIPAGVDAEGLSPFVTVLCNGSLYSKTIPPRIVSGDEILIEPVCGGSAGIEVTSNPPGAAIVVDGFATGQVTPSLIGNLSQGQHLVETFIPGYYPASRLVAVVDDPSTPADLSVGVSLEKYVSGTLTVASSPEGAKIYIYGKDTGRKTPSIFEYLHIGTVNGRVRWDDAERDFEVDILPGENLTVNLSPPEKK